MTFYIILAYSLFVWIKVDYDVKHKSRIIEINQMLYENSFKPYMSMKSMLFLIIIFSPILYWVIILIQIKSHLFGIVQLLKAKIEIVFLKIKKKKVELKYKFLKIKKKKVELKYKYMKEKNDTLESDNLILVKQIIELSELNIKKAKEARSEFESEGNEECVLLIDEYIEDANEKINYYKTYIN